MWRSIGLLVCIVIVGCGPEELASQPPLCEPPPASACDAPTPVHPDEITNVASFRAQASAAVCDWSLRCEWGLSGDQFCHPRFAASLTPIDNAPFDASLARACVERLADVTNCDGAFEIAIECLSLSLGDWRDGLIDDGWRVTGAACVDQCSFALACVDGVCVRPAGLGQECGPTPCESALLCADGVCRYAHVGESCAGAECEPGAECAGQIVGTGWLTGAPIYGSPFWCRASEMCPAPVVHHAGCGCAADHDCPADVARCVRGRCALRPFRGDACTLDGAPCYRGACANGTCT